MKKIVYLSIFLIVSSVSNGQNKAITKSGTITFEASIPSFEEIKATNNDVSCVLHTKTGEINSLVLVKLFKFRIPLMEEHFNENYVESNKHPKATFKGKIENFDINVIDKTEKEFNLSGKFEIHGESKKISTKIRIKRVENKIEIKANFDINTDDYKIEIPKLVSKKISKKVNLDIHFLLVVFH